MGSNRSGNGSADHHDVIAEGPRPLDRSVFWISALIALGFVAWGVFGTSSLASVSSAALAWVIHNTGWAFVLAATGFVVFALWLAVSRYGNIPLGADGEEPEFRTSSWLAMMFSAGMGIGLMFYGVSEPLGHFASPPPLSGVAPGTPGALEVAMATSLFHWTLHPWAIYAVVGLAIAYGTFRAGRSQLISSAFVPLFGAKVARGPVGKAIDAMAIFATLFGSAASLGLGTLQIAAGLREMGWIESIGVTLMVVVIALLTCAFVASAVSGVAKGIQWLSNVNMVLASLLALFLFVVGPTVLILNLIPTATAVYFRDLAAMVSRTDASGGPAMQQWLTGWTVFYWAWWISWTPFVGMFLARISRGRTIRQFVAGVILIPSTVSLIWFAIMGGSAIEVHRTGTDLYQAGKLGQEAQMFTMLGELPLSTATSALVIFLVAIFFVSGADAASVVMGTLSHRGSIAPRRSTVIFWGTVMGGVAAVMLLVGGGGTDALVGLRNVTIVVALPFTVVMVLLCVSLAKELRGDPLVRRHQKAAEVVEAAVQRGNRQYDGEFGIAITPPDRAHAEPEAAPKRDN